MILKSLTLHDIQRRFILSDNMIIRGVILTLISCIFYSELAMNGSVSACLHLKNIISVNTLFHTKHQEKVKSVIYGSKSVDCYLYSAVLW